MYFELTPSQQLVIQSIVDSGEYPDAESVVEAALVALEERQVALTRLRSNIGVGLQQIRDGKVTIDSDEMWDEIEARANRRYRDSDKECFDV